MSDVVLLGMKSTYIFLILLALVVAGGMVYLFRPQADLKPKQPLPEPVGTPIDNTVPLGSVEPTPPPIVAIDQVVRATLETSLGNIDLELNGPAAPFTVGNFVHLAQEDFYDGTSFHRVIPDFMIQGGDPLSKDPNLRPRHGTGGPGYSFQDEINQENIVRGSLAMANSGPNTNGSQFFIVVAEATPHLDGLHTNFGKVTAGLDVVDAIVAVDRDARDNPVEAVVIKDVILHDAPQTGPAVEVIE